MQVRIVFLLGVVVILGMLFTTWISFCCSIRRHNQAYNEYMKVSKFFFFKEALAQRLFLGK